MEAGMSIRALAASALLFAATMHAQTSAAIQNQAGVVTLKVSTRIVVLDVVVTDQKGNLVNNLTRDDFAILEDRAPQTIQSFGPPSSHRMPANVVVNSSADLTKIGGAPVTILVLDELNTRF